MLPTAFACAQFVNFGRLNLPGEVNPNCHLSGKKNKPKPKLFGPDIFGRGGGLPCEGVGAKKFDMSLETREIELFWRDIPGFCRDIPGGAQTV